MGACGADRKKRDEQASAAYQPCWSSDMTNIIRRMMHGVRFLAAGPFSCIERVGLLLGWFAYILYPKPVRRRIKGVLFEFDFSLSPYVKGMYFGWYSVAVTNCMESILRPGDTFIDIGANIGYITAIGAGFVGKRGEVHSFEPAAPHFRKLEKLSNMNRDYRIIVNQCALGEGECEAGLHITGGHLGGNSMVSGERPADSVKVAVRRFDAYAEEKKLKNIKLVKIDVEGYEFPVLKGFRDYFEKNSDRPVIICEIFPFAYPQHGATLKEFLDYMGRYGYKGYSIHSPQKEIEIAGLTGEEGYDVLFRSCNVTASSAMK